MDPERRLVEARSTGKTGTRLALVAATNTAVVGQDEAARRSALQDQVEATMNRAAVGRVAVAKNGTMADAVATGKSKMVVVPVVSPSRIRTAAGQRLATFCRGIPILPTG
jgi:hypothetical protein